MPELQRPAVDGTADLCNRAHKLGVTVALDDLGRNFISLQPELPADVLLNLRVHVRIRADRAGDFSDSDYITGPLESFERPPKLVVHQRHLQPKRDRLSVD